MTPCRSSQLGESTTKPCARARRSVRSHVGSWPVSDLSDRRRCVCSWGFNGHRMRGTPRSVHDPKPTLATMSPSSVRASRRPRLLEGIMSSAGHSPRQRPGTERSAPSHRMQGEPRPSPQATVCSKRPSSLDVYAALALPASVCPLKRSSFERRTTLVRAPSSTSTSLVNPLGASSLARREPLMRAPSSAENAR